MATTRGTAGGGEKQGDGAAEDHAEQIAERPGVNAGTGEKSGRPQRNQGVWRRMESDNRLFREYYQGQGLVPEGEWESFLSALRTPLPTTFRVTQGAYLFRAITERLEEFARRGPVVVGGEDPVTIPAPSPLTWYPNRAAWHLPVSKKALKRSPELTDLYRFLVAQNEQGNVSRQEAVSMIPPLLLDVKRNHRVWDMCAAPGSKTTELLEILHSGCEPGEMPSGYVVANDVDIDRCHLLVHNTKRMGSPCFLVTCHSAESFPRPSPLIGADGREEPFAFDRILCDVCCSGDGTLRKSPDLWSRWHPRLGTGLHKLQSRIASRGVALLKPGGRMVYSTCSLNPIEDEAVVASLLLASNGELQLVDVSNELPGLKRMPGVNHWRVMVGDRAAGGCKWVDRHEELEGQQAESIALSCFPPSPEIASSLHLERCIRVLPHHQDTGGFFIAVLAKKDSASVPSKVPATETSPAVACTASGAPAECYEAPAAEEKKKKRTPGRRAAQMKALLLKEAEIPYTIVAETPRFEEMVRNVRDFYGLDDSSNLSQLVTRCKDLDKLMLVNSGVLSLMKSTPTSRLRVVSVGMKMLQAQRQRHIVKCGYRLSMESLAWILPHLGTARIARGKKSDLCVLLGAEDVEIEVLPSESLRSSLAMITPGCFVFVDEEDGLSLCAWRGASCCHLLVPKEELASLRNLYAPHIPAPVGTQSSSLAKDANLPKRPVQP